MYPVFWNGFLAFLLPHRIHSEVEKIVDWVPEILFAACVAHVLALLDLRCMFFGSDGAPERRVRAVNTDRRLGGPSCVT